VLAQQYKPEEALKAFDKMIAIGIKPTDMTFTQLMLSFAKKRNVEKVLELHKLAADEYGLTAPSINRMNSILLAYCKNGEPWKAEDLMRDMRDEMGMEPDVVCYTTLIDGYRKNNQLDRCWELYNQCSEK